MFGALAGPCWYVICKLRLGNPTLAWLISSFKRRMGFQIQWESCEPAINSWGRLTPVEIISGTYFGNQANPQVRDSTWFGQGKKWFSADPVQQDQALSKHSRGHIGTTLDIVSIVFCFSVTLSITSVYVGIAENNERKSNMCMLYHLLSQKSPLSDLEMISRTVTWRPHFKSLLSQLWPELALMQSLIQRPRRRWDQQAWHLLWLWKKYACKKRHIRT